MKVYRSTFFQNFTPVPDDLFDPRCSLTNTEKLVYIIYLKHTDRNSGVAWPGNKRVAEMAQISIPSLKRISANLEIKGYISKEARFNEKGQQLTNLIIVHHPLETRDFEGGIKNNTPTETGEGIKFDTPNKLEGGIIDKTPGGITHDTQTKTNKNKNEEEERITEGENIDLPANNFESRLDFREDEDNTLIIQEDWSGNVNTKEKKITEEGRERLTAANPDETETTAYPFSNLEPPGIYERPPLGQEKGHDSNDLVEMVREKLGIEHTLAFLLVARCQNKLDKVIHQLVNAKKPIQNMTAYLLTLLAHPDQWDLFMENVDNEFLTRERPKKKRESRLPMEEREIYMPPSVFFASENSSLLQKDFPRHRWGIVM